jgi:hypothetical protein
VGVRGRNIRSFSRQLSNDPGEYSQQYQEESTSILSKYIPKQEEHIDLKRALELTAPSFGDEKNWGQFDERIVQSFLDWIYEKNLETSRLGLSEIVSNEYVDSNG